MEKIESTTTIPNAGSSVGQEENKGNKTKTEKTTANRLFPDFVNTKIPGAGILQETEPEQKKPSETKAVDEPKPETKPQAEKYLTLEDFKSAKVKLKVDGVEEEATFEDVVRRAQLDTHLTKKGQRLSEEEKRVRAKEQSLEEREKLLTEMLAQSKTEEKHENAESIVKDDPYVKRMEADLKKTQEALRALTVQAEPMLLQAAIDRVSSHVKETMGLDDFSQYRGKIKEYLMSMPPEQGRAMDNESGWLAAYKDLKLKELMAQAKAPKEEPKPTERIAPKVVPIEGGKNASVGVIDDRDSKRRSLFEKARRLSEEGSFDRHSAWEEYLAFQSSDRANS